jgi:hypothetical protein
LKIREKASKTDDSAFIFWYAAVKFNDPNFSNANIKALVKFEIDGNLQRAEIEEFKDKNLRQELIIFRQESIKEKSRQDKIALLKAVRN